MFGVVALPLLFSGSLATLSCLSCRFFVIASSQRSRSRHAAAIQSNCRQRPLMFLIGLSLCEAERRVRNIYYIYVLHARVHMTTSIYCSFSHCSAPLSLAMQAWSISTTILFCKFARFFSLPLAAFFVVAVYRSLGAIVDNIVNYWTTEPCLFYICVLLRWFGNWNRFFLPSARFNLNWWLMSQSSLCAHIAKTVNIFHKVHCSRFIRYFSLWFRCFFNSLCTLRYFLHIRCFFFVAQQRCYTQNWFFYHIK